MTHETNIMVKSLTVTVRSWRAFNAEVKQSK